RIRARVEAGDSHGARCRGSERQCGQGGCEGAPPPSCQSSHWNAPLKLVAAKAGRGASESSSAPKKLGGSTTPFVASFSRKCGFSPVHWRGERSRPRPPLGLCSS